MFRFYIITNHFNVSISCVQTQNAPRGVSSYITHWRYVLWASGDLRYYLNAFDIFYFVWIISPNRQKPPRWFCSVAIKDFDDTSVQTGNINLRAYSQIQIFGVGEGDTQILKYFKLDKVDMFWERWSETQSWCMKMFSDWFDASKKSNVEKA